MNRQTVIRLLIIAALIEARSLERFHLLATNLSDPELAALYAELVPSEAAHHGLFMKFARELFGLDVADVRAQRLTELEGEIVSKLPFAHRLLLKAIFGIRASKLLLDLRDPQTRATDYRFYGFVTRTSGKKIFIQSDLDISKGHGTVISGEGLEAALQVLQDYLDSEESSAA